MKRLLIIAAILIVIGMGVYVCRPGNGMENKQYRTGAVEKGDLIQYVKATGVVEPVKMVQVGSQVTGQIQKLFVDYNNPVTAGQIIAQIDDTSFLARVAQDQAALSKSLAVLEQSRAKLAQAQKEFERDQELAQNNVISESDMETSLTNRDTLKAQVKVSEADVKQSQANLDNSKTQLGYTKILSPVDGVVISRNVDEGQTVTAALNVQTIFVIASDLSRIYVEGSIPEADIGRIKEGQEVIFSVDAYPDEKFEGRVKEVRIASTTVQNVVTYPIIIEADNLEKKLLPGMTADISVEVARHEQALKVPNAALRFKPENVSPEKPGKSEHQVWLKSEQGLMAVAVTTGITDGSYTEVISERLEPGQEIVTGIEEQTSEEKTVNNPFMPKFPGKGKKSGGDE